MESGSGIGEFECDDQPLSWGKSPGFVNLVLFEYGPEFACEFAWTSRTTWAGSQAFRSHAGILQGTIRSVTTRPLKQSAKRHTLNSAQRLPSLFTFG